MQPPGLMKMSSKSEEPSSIKQVALDSCRE